MQTEDLVHLLKNKLGDLSIAIEDNKSPAALRVGRTDVKAILQELYRNPATYFDMLSCITGVDNGSEADTMEVIYNLYSIPFNLQLMVMVELPRENPETDTVSDIWQTADWHEREAYDLFGIKFIGHPDLRRILMPADWEGYPLRKDYEHQEYYRGIKVEY